jgi:phage terminase small subunit
MARGGYRPSAGRKAGSKDKAPRKKPVAPPPVTEKQKLNGLLSYDLKAKAKMYSELLARIGDKTGKLKPLTLAEKKYFDKLGAELSQGLAEDVKKDAESKDAESKVFSPLDYMLQVMNDPQADKDRRDKMAIAAAPFMHARKGEGGGKKDERADKAKEAGKGKFAPGAPPLKVVK